MLVPSCQSRGRENRDLPGQRSSVDGGAPAVPWASEGGFQAGRQHAGWRAGGDSRTLHCHAPLSRTWEPEPPGPGVGTQGPLRLRCERDPLHTMAAPSTPEQPPCRRWTSLPALFVILENHVTETNEATLHCGCGAALTPLRTPAPGHVTQVHAQRCSGDYDLRWGVGRPLAEPRCEITASLSYLCIWG